MDKDLLEYKADCRHFVGYIPCRPHKQEGVHCFDCKYYEPKKDKILIIKLGAIGDVIRTTPLLHKLRSEYPDSEIWWLTYSPEVLPSSIDRIYKFNPESLLVLEETAFSLLINLDKDPQACALANRVEAPKKIGYGLKNGKPAPLDKAAEHKFVTGLFDDVSKANRKSYPREIFEICGWEFNNEEYILEVDESVKWAIPSAGKPVIGLNTGCGSRWVSRLWADENWIELINLLNENGYFPMLLGGEQEHKKNDKFSDKTGAFYPGHFSLKKFISLVNQCDGVVTAVTMGLHIAMGLHKKVILMNNIFNPYEFEMYGRGEIVQPEKECRCYFSPKCTNDNYFCMDSLKPEAILEAVKRQVRD